MRTLTRAATLKLVAGAAGSLLAGAAAASSSLRDVLRLAGARPLRPERLTPAGMMGTSVDMGVYMDLFHRHTEIRRTVEEIPGGVRTVTESSSPDLVAKLQEHVASMYDHLDRGAEVTCMSASLPTLFRYADGYRRTLRLTKRGVAVTETSSHPELVEAIRAHAREVSGFVREGMQAMMRGR
ncbi:MAG TPA: hypothetical protein VFB35_05890 [Gaiellaceae bacterium]|nr:hypothetical protein [Gaiellaceae bacterium]